jgi:hypothetical protein
MSKKKDLTPPISNVPYVVEVWGEMWTTNAERSMHHYTRAKKVKEWRSATCVAAKARKIPRMKVIEVRFTPHKRNRQGMADTGNHFPVAKAMIDGLVDAGILIGDGPDTVRRLVFEAPVISGESKARLEIIELE